MTARRLISRRMLLKDMGKAGMAVMILGTAACSSESVSTTTSALATSTTAGSPPTTNPAAATSSTSAPTGYGWHQVNLDFVSAYILYRDGEAVLVDTGVGGSEGDIEAGLSEVGLGWGDVGGVIVTHLHPDHQGSLPAVLSAVNDGVPWFAGAADLGGMNADGGQAAGDGDQVNGLKIIETPGHTSGHISVLDEAGGVLVTGDALNGGDGGVTGPNPRFTPDMETANQSVVKLAGFDYEVALFGHGEPVLAGASAAVADLAESL